MEEVWSTVHYAHYMQRRRRLCRTVYRGDAVSLASLLLFLPLNSVKSFELSLYLDGDLCMLLKHSSISGLKTELRRLTANRDRVVSLSVSQRLGRDLRQRQTD